MNTSDEYIIKELENKYLAEIQERLTDEQIRFNTFDRSELTTIIILKLKDLAKNHRTTDFKKEEIKCIIKDSYRDFLKEQDDVPSFFEIFRSYFILETESKEMEMFVALVNFFELLELLCLEFITKKVHLNINEQIEIKEIRPKLYFYLAYYFQAQNPFISKIMKEWRSVSINSEELIQLMQEYLIIEGKFFHISEENVNKFISAYFKKSYNLSMQIKAGIFFDSFSKYYTKIKRTWDYCQQKNPFYYFFNQDNYAFGLLELLTLKFFIEGKTIIGKPSLTWARQVSYFYLRYFLNKSSAFVDQILIHYGHKNYQKTTMEYDAKTILGKWKEYLLTESKNWDGDISKDAIEKFINDRSACLYRLLRKV